MNYIWELLIRAEEEGIEPKEITFKYPAVFSPYMELNFESLNTTTVMREVDVNPYIRFNDIFATLFDRNNHEDIELREKIFDILIHFLGEVDRWQGMNKREYYIQFVVDEILTGAFGRKIQAYFELCNPIEREIIASSVLRMYKLGESIYVFKDTVQSIFKYSIIFANAREKDELMIYICEAKTPLSEKKLSVLKDLFLPFQFDVEIYWEYIFGIIDVDEAMQLDRIVVY